MVSGHDKPLQRHKMAATMVGLNLRRSPRASHELNDIDCQLSERASDLDAKFAVQVEGDCFLVLPGITMSPPKTS
jgi:hypothetical protein